jgi:adenylosuccinate synthase
MLTAITGINWGDEGKGRMVDLLSQEYDIVARYQGGDNAGHTVKNDRGKFVLNLIPSGILRPEVVCVMGGGMVIDPEHLEKEIADLRAKGIAITPKNLKISDQATITMPFHVEQDGLEEARLSKTGAQFGSTKRGIAYTYGDKFMKKTLRMGDLLHLDDAMKKRLSTIVESKNLTMVNIYGQKPVALDAMWDWCRRYGEVFGPYICDAGAYLAAADDAGKKIMFEAQLGALRDIDYGIYPYTSSSNTVSAYAPIGAGIPGHKLDLSVGIMKAYSSCVGEGPFTAELAMTEEEMHLLRESGHEYGAATGRPRRVGPFDVVASRYGVQCQGCDELALTLLDVLDYRETIPVVAKYRLSDGTLTDRFPMGEALDTAQPVVENLPGWHCDITAARTFDQLPAAAQNYVRYVEKAVGCKIKYISVGPERDACITR